MDENEKEKVKKHAHTNDRELSEVLIDKHREKGNHRIDLLMKHCYYYFSIELV